MLQEGHRGHINLAKTSKKHTKNPKQLSVVKQKKKDLRKREAEVHSDRQRMWSSPVPQSF